MSETNIAPGCEVTHVALDMREPLQSNANLTVGEAVKQLRTALKLDTKAFASRLEVHPDSVSRMERGGREPSVSLMLKLYAWSGDVQDAAWAADLQRAFAAALQAAGVAESAYRTPAQPALQIPLDQLHEHPLNPRRYYSPAGLQELAASMRAEGFRDWKPLIVTPREDGGYWIAAGHRRTRAARMAGLTQVWAEVRELTEAQVRDILNFDNDGTEEVHPLHRAAGWQQLIADGLATVKGIAERIGKEIGTVYQCLKYSALIERAQQAFLDGRIKGAHAILIARLPESLQIAATEFCTGPAYDSERTVSVSQLKRWIEDHCYLTIDGKHFNYVDETLIPAAGNCIECPKRSGSQPEIFADLDPMTCTDPACYRAKLDTTVARENARQQIATATREPEPDPEREEQPQGPSPDAQAEAEVRRIEKGHREWQLEQRQRYREAQEKRAAEEQRIRIKAERAQTVYANAVKAIVEKVDCLTAGDAVALLIFLAGPLDCMGLLADEFAIPRKRDTRYQDLKAAAPKLPTQKIARMIVYAILTELSITEGVHDSEVLADFARRYKVNLAKIGKEVDAEIDARLGLRKLNPPAAPKDARKQAIARLPTLGQKTAAKKGKK